MKSRSVDALGPWCRRTTLTVVAAVAVRTGSVRSPESWDPSSASRLCLPDSELITVLPADVLTDHEQVVARRGLAAVGFKHPSALRVLQELFKQDTPLTTTAEELISRFALTDRAIATDMLAALCDARIVQRGSIASDHYPSSLNIFESLGLDLSALHARLERARVLVVGQEQLTAATVAALRSSGVGVVDSLDITAIDVVEQHLEHDAVELVVALSAFGFEPCFKAVAEVAIRHSIALLPAIFLQPILYVGPLWLSSDTPCPDCLRLRLAANGTAFGALLNMKTHISRSVEPAFHPAIAAAASGLVAMECIRALATPHVPLTADSVQEVNFLAGTCSTRSVLKVPHCLVCASGSVVPRAFAWERLRLPEV